MAQRVHVSWLQQKRSLLALFFGIIDILSRFFHALCCLLAWCSFLSCLHFFIVVVLTVNAVMLQTKLVVEHSKWFLFAFGRVFVSVFGLR